MDPVTAPSITVYALNGQGGVLPFVSLDSLEQPNEPSIWIHFDYTNLEAQQWLNKHSRLENIICEALLAQETRPRTVFTHQGILMTLRAINASPEYAPEDMASLRIWIEEKRIITSSRRPIPAIDELISALLGHIGPSTMIELLTELTDHILTHVFEVISEIDTQVDLFEEDIVKKIREEGHRLRLRLATIRQRIITLRRHLAPQREALSRIHMIELPWLSSLDKLHLLELADRTILYLEDLDEARDRATVIQETIANIISEQIGYRMYILSMVAAIFMPLGLITGMLGMNVAGIPLAEHKDAFACVVILIILLGFLEYWAFKKKRWV